MKAYELAKIFLDKNPNLSMSCNDSNIILNKLMYFTNLMYYSLYDKPLITDDKVEKIDHEILSNQNKVINIINLIYAHKSVEELLDEISDDKELDFSKIELMRNYYELYEDLDFENLKYEKINGNEYYYMADNLELNDDIMKELEKNPKFDEVIFLELMDNMLVYS